MNWKNWPYWKKGALLVGGVYLLFILGLTQNSHTPPAEDGSAPLTRGELRRLRMSYILIASVFIFLAQFNWGDPVGKAYGIGIWLILIFFPSSLLAFSQVALFFFGPVFLVAVPIINIFLFVCIGSLLGYLYGKSKNRKQLST